jgi:hypothetical protein
MTLAVAGQRRHRGHRRGEPQVHLGRGLDHPHRRSRHRLRGRPRAAHRPPRHRARVAQHRPGGDLAHLRCATAPAGCAAADGDARRARGGHQPAPQSPVGWRVVVEQPRPRPTGRCGPRCKVRCGWQRGQPAGGAGGGAGIGVAHGAARCGCWPQGPNASGRAAGHRIDLQADATNCSSWASASTTWPPNCRPATAAWSGRCGNARVSCRKPTRPSRVCWQRPATTCASRCMR